MATWRLKPTRSKYGAKRCTIDGEAFDSQGEAARWQELRLLERAKQIAALVRQVRVPLEVQQPSGDPVVIGEYVADFAYLEADRYVLEDFKGCDTPLSAWKRKHVKAQTGIAVRITGKARTS
jgi:hypothetical protein